MATSAFGVAEWKAPEWPPEDSGAYSADISLWGTVEAIGERTVHQKQGGSNVIKYTAFRVIFDRAVRVKDELDEETLAAALGPNSVCDVASRFELWLEGAAGDGVKVGSKICATTKGACLVIRAILLSEFKAKVKGSDAIDEIAKRQAEYVKQFKEPEGAGESEWD